MNVYLFIACVSFFAQSIWTKPLKIPNCKKNKLSPATEKYISSLPAEQQDEYKELMEQSDCLSEAVKNKESKKQKKTKIHKAKRNVKREVVENPLTNDNESLYHEGDILLSVEQLRALFEQYTDSEQDNNEARRKRKITDDPLNKWPSVKAIPYFVDSEISAAYKTVILETLAYYESETCLRFVEDTSTHYMRFVSGGGCSSYIGYLQRYSQFSGYQQVSIGSNCDKLYIVYHEIGHALGFHHEQSRVDRDNYVSVDLSTVTYGMEGNYDKMTSMLDYGAGYDYGSDMHYGENDFGNDTGPVMLAVDPRYQDTLRTREISFIDLLQVNAHYCSGECSGATSVSCENGGYPDPNDCTKCKCPQGFGGSRCTQVQTSSTTSTNNCGSTTKLTATTEWTNLDASEGIYDYITPALHCHWQIESPINTQIQLRFPSSITSYCATGCVWDYVEVKTGVDPGTDSNQAQADFRRAGYRFCCSDIVSLGEFSSFSNLAVVTLLSNWGEVAFTLQYRYTASVTAPPTTTTAPPTTTTAPPTTTTAPPTTTTAPPTTTTAPPTTTTTIPLTTTTSPSSGVCGYTNWSEWLGDCCGGCRYRTRECDEDTNCECSEDYSNYYSLQDCLEDDGVCKVTLSGVQKCRPYGSLRCPSREYEFLDVEGPCCPGWNLNRRGTWCK